MHTKEDKLKAFERLLDVQERLRRYDMLKPTLFR